MSNDQIIKTTLDIAAKTGSLICLFIIYAGVPIALAGLWYYGMKVLVGDF